MRWARPKSLTGLMLLGLALIAGPLLVAVVDAAIQIRSLTLTSQQMVLNGVRVARLSQSLFADIRQLDRTVKLYQVLGDVKLLEAYRNTDQSLAATRTELAALLDSDELPEEARRRLWRSVRRELDRMQRLLAQQETPATDLDVDDALGVILDLQRLKGRHVEYRSSGDTVHARYDALAEVVNILMDNAATHGGSDSSVVEVASHDDMVDIKVTDFGRGIPADKCQQIFGWGVRGSDSPGEGIGLNVAQRLMNEDGGSLRLAEPGGGGKGSSFVISLPRARQSSENHLARKGSHVGWNGPS